MRFEVSVDIATSPEEVWSVLQDLERWPEWTASMTSLRRLDDGQLRVGSRVEIAQPKLPRTVWTVTEFSRGTSFAWEARGPGVRTSAVHELSGETSSGATTSRVRLAVETTGPLAPLVKLLLGRLTERYVRMEATGLKQVCEATQ